jgi:hypothetical protein
MDEEGAAIEPRKVIAGLLEASGLLRNNTLLQRMRVWIQSVPPGGMKFLKDKLLLIAALRRAWPAVVVTK